MIGTKLSQRYEITAELGRGGMGVVYRGHDPDLRREVAIKLLFPAALTEAAEQRFRREAQLVAQLDHPAIVPIYDIGRHDEYLFFVMPVVRGKTLQTLSREGSLRLGETLEIAAQVADGLDCSHERGVVHRDMKPENIMVDREEGQLRARVMDFGLALDDAAERLTRTGHMPGTLAYLSPEQVLGVDVDGRSDLYSLGTILFECLSGEVPFSGVRHSLLYRIVNEEPPPLGTRGVDEALEKIVLRCLAKEPDERPQRGSELAAALRDYAASLSRESRTRDVATYRAGGPQDRRPSAVPLVGRAREMGELRHRLDEAVAGECQFVVLGGEAGMGKTRLLAELEILARERGIRVLHGSFSDPDSAFPYQGFGETIQDYFRRKATESSAPEIPPLGDLGAELQVLFPSLTELGNWPAVEVGAAEARRAAEAAGRGDRSHLFELLARTLACLAGGKPTVVLLEHLHHTEASIAALQYVVRRLGPTPTLIVGTYRQTEIARGHPLVRMLRSFKDEPRFASLVLEPLTPSEHRELVVSLLGGPQITAEVAERLYEASEGNPFFTQELVRSLVDGGEVTRDDTGVWTLSGETGFATDALPETIQQAVGSRLELLPQKLRDLLRTASVLGRSFDFEDLQALVAVADADDAVEQLIRERILEEDPRSRGDHLHFSSGVVRDVLYGDLSRRRRRELHRRHAEQLEARYAGRLERVYPQLVHHFAAGDVAGKAVDYALRLARGSQATFGSDAAIHAIRTALELVEEEEVPGAVEGELRLRLATALRATGSAEAAMKEAARAVRVLARTGQAEGAAEAALVVADTAWQARKVGETRRWVEQGIAMAREVRSTATLRQLLTLGATAANLRGEYAQARAFWEEGEELAAADQPPPGSEPVPRGGTLRTSLPLGLTTLDLGMVPTTEEKEVLGNVFETLIQVDPEGHLRPGLCEEWEGSPDDRTFRLTLRRDVRFADGEPLTPEAVKRSLEASAQRAGDRLPAAYATLEGIESFRRGEAEEIGGIAVGGEVTVRFQLAEPLPIFPVLLTDLSTAIRRVGAEGELVGTGPFRIAAHDGEQITLARNERYWRGTSPPLERIVFRTSLDASGIAAGLRSGELDLGRDFLPADLEEVLRDPALRAGLVEVTRNNVYFVAFNRSGPTVARREVRQALCDVVRVEDIVWRTLGRFAQPAACLLPPAILGHQPGRRRPQLGRVPALEMLCSAGLVPPVRLRVAVLPLLLDRYGPLTRALFEEWARIGVEVVIETTTMESFLARAQDSDGIDAWIGRWSADYEDPDNFTFGLLHSGRGYLPRYLASEPADRLLEKARRESRASVRQVLYRRFESLLVRERAVLPLYHDVDYRIARPEVRGLRLLSTPPYVNYAQIGIRRRGEETAAAADRDSGPSLRRGGTITVPLRSSPPTLEPARACSVDRAEVTPNVFETLTRVDEGARIVPCLASEIEVEERGRRFRFRLRQNVSFHHGPKLTARDVRYSFERLLRTDHGCGAETLLASIRGAAAFREGRASEVAGLRILSPGELVVELEEPVASFPAMLTSPTTAIVPEGTTCFAGNWRDGCAGTGPFRVVRFDPAEQVELEANPHYWRPGYPRCERLIFELGLDPERILAEFRSGRLSLVSNLRPDDVEALRKDPELAAGYRETPGFSTFFLALNRRRGPFSDPAIRSAFRRTLRVEVLVRSVLGRLGQPAQGLIPPGLIGYEAAAEPGSGDQGPVGRAGDRGIEGPEPPALAGLELRAAVVSTPGVEVDLLWDQLGATCREAGITLKVAYDRRPDTLRAIAEASADLVATRFTATYPDSDLFVNLLDSRSAIGQFIGDPEIDRLVARGRAETDPVRRHGIYREIEQILACGSLLVPLFHQQVYRFARPEIRGQRLQFGWPEVAYEELSLAP